MYPSLPVGPLSLPTAQILAIAAAWFGLSVMVQAARRLRLDPDLIWNLGTIALGAALIVARLSHAVQFWSVYRAEPLLLISLRPGGLLFWPGVAAALVAAYLYLIYKQLDPRPVAVAAVFGLLAGGAVLEVSNFLTGATLGMPTALAAAAPWVLTWFGEPRHPVALYRAMAMMFVVGGFLLWGNWRRPVQLAGQAILAHALLRLFVDGFMADARLIGPLRLSQLGSFALALAMAMFLARTSNPDGATDSALTD